MGTFLYYACAVEFTILPEINKIVKQQANQTHNTEAVITLLLYYAATNMTTMFQYKSSGMILHIYSDASYLSEPRACSHTESHYYLSLLPANPEKSPNLPTPENGQVHTK